MGMPRYLKNRLNKLYKTSPRDDEFLLFFSFEAGMTFRSNRHEFSERFGEYVSATKNSSEEAKANIYRCLIRWGFKHHFYKRCADTPSDSMERIESEKYVGSVERGSEVYAQRVKVKIPRFFQSGLIELNKLREQEDRRQLQLKYEILEVQQRIYVSRTFPDKLRQIIFERDNYTCQVCLRDRAALIPVNLHLEVDHILAWEDGGKTEYTNGQTICSQCNKGKHSAKRHIVNRLALARG